MSKLPANIQLGAVHLRVRSLARALRFYQEVLGFWLHDQTADKAVLSAGSNKLAVLYEDPAALPRLRGRTGLYHFAVLVPTRRELAHVLHNIAQREYPWQGAADHDVSEALYLADPDGNGIEIYRDRPREEWQYQDDGTLVMGTYRLDLANLLAELENGPDEAAPAWSQLNSDSVMGHMHLHVHDIAEAEAFYGDVLGFDLMVRYGDSASFMSAGGYHHHLGLNIWAGRGAPPAPENSVGLRWFDLFLPDEAALAAAAERLQAAGVAITEDEDGLLVHDPSQNGIRLRMA